VPVSMLLALLASLCIPRSVFPHGCPIIPGTDTLRRESSPTDVTPAYPFVKLCHNACALLTTYVYQGGVSKPMSKQILVDQVVLAQILFDYSGLYGFQREYPINQAASIGRHLGFVSINQENLL